MRKSIIEEIFYGNEGNFSTIKTNEKYKSIFNSLLSIQKLFEKTLTDAQKESFKKFCNVQDELDIETINLYYIKGFKLGVLVGIECMED